MNYLFEVAYINSLRPKKIVPEKTFYELENNKSFAAIISVLKEFNYKKIFEIIDIRDAYLFESVIITELNDTLELLNSLFKERHKWLTEWFKKFFLFIKKEDIVSYFIDYFDKFMSLNSKLCQRLLKLIIDFENIKLFLSYTVVSEQKDVEKKFIPYGNLDHKILSRVYPSIDLLNKQLAVVYPAFRVEVTTDAKKENYEYFFRQYLNMLIWESKFYYATLEPLVFYFFEKLVETQRIKQIYYDIKIS